MTDRAIFFDLLHAGRELKEKGLSERVRHIFLQGMKYHYYQHVEDLKIAENQREVWAQRATGSVDWRG